MNRFKTAPWRAFLVAPIVSVLVACGGDAEAPGVKPAEFVAMAQTAACTEERNRLYLIDDAYVLWDTAGDCAYVSPAYKLFGKTPSALLCSYTSQPVGAFTVCSDDSVRAMFSTMILHLDQSDFGLGAQHQVREIVF